MNVQSRNGADWWAELPPGQKTFVRDLAWTVELMFQDEVLELRRQGRAYAALLRCRSRPAEVPHSQLLRPRPAPDCWWAGLRTDQRRSFRVLARIVPLLCGAMVLQIRRCGPDLELTWVFAQGGTAQMN